MTRTSGLALLIVIATLAVVISMLAGMARIAGATVMSRSIADEMAAADEMLHASSSSILHWLSDRADTVVLPPDIPSPEVPVLADEWQAQGRVHVLQITAWDQGGMTPWTLARALLRDRLGAQIVDRIESSVRQKLPPGLDLLEGADTVVFPRPGQGGQVAIGAVLATHNPFHARPDDGPVINVNTAPRALLEAACAEVNVVDAIVQARRDGQRWRVAGDWADGTGGGRLSSHSMTWAFRIDATAGRVQRSAWEVYIRHGSGWSLVQRLVIPE